MAYFNVQFRETLNSFDVQFQKTSAMFTIGFGAVSVLPTAEIYSGSYEVTPAVNSQNIPTAQKFLKYDMTVKAIPYYDVSNLAGGTTVYIGKELE